MSSAIQNCFRGQISTEMICRRRDILADCHLPPYYNITPKHLLTNSAKGNLQSQIGIESSLCNSTHSQFATTSSNSLSSEVRRRLQCIPCSSGWNIKHFVLVLIMAWLLKYLNQMGLLFNKILNSCLKPP